jgi:soluble lytic murein transglycosylase
MQHLGKPLLFLIILLLMAGGLLHIWGKRLVAQSRLYEPLIIDAANRYHIDADLIRAVIWRESDFQPGVTGLARERGLMQVTPNAGQEWAKAEKIATFRETDLFDPRTNIQAGTWYLARAINRWNNADQPEAFALAEYNAGRTHARRWASPLMRWEAVPFIDGIDYPTTKAYIRDILEKRVYYKANPNSPTAWRAVRNEISARIWRWRQAMSAKKSPVSPQGT